MNTIADAAKSTNKNPGRKEFHRGTYQQEVNPTSICT